MIPTREQIEADWASPRFTPETTALIWLRAMRDEIDRLQADLDRANTEAALARDALAKATTPAPEREAKIKAWEMLALEDAADSDLYDDCFVLERHEIEDAVALMRSAGDGKALLRELRAWIWGEWANQSFGSVPRILNAIDEMLARPAPVEQPAAAVPYHFTDTGKMVPVLYWLEDGKFARAMLVGKDLLVVDLTFGDGPSVVGKPEWFDAGYVATYGGLVPESATQGKEPGQWDYGVASIAKPAAAVPDDTRELVAQLADLVAWAMPTMNHHKGVKAIAAKLRGGSTVPVEGTSDEILQLPRDDQRWELVAQLADVVASIWGRSDCIEGEAKAIAAKLRGGA